MQDWLRQVDRDMEVAQTTATAGQFDWACFAAQQSAEKALKALYQHHHAEGWGHVLARLIEELATEESELQQYLDMAKSLDKFTFQPAIRTGSPPALRRTRIHAQRPSRRLNMPSRSSHTVRHDAVPEAQVFAAARRWAEHLLATCPEVRSVGCFGSYARGDYVPGSDLDVLIEVSALHTGTSGQMADRADPYLPAGLPVGVELLVYTTEELKRLRAEKNAFLRTVEGELQWLARRS